MITLKFHQAIYILDLCALCMQICGDVCKCIYIKKGRKSRQRPTGALNQSIHSSLPLARHGKYCKEVQ